MNESKNISLLPFVPLYFRDKIRIINPEGYVGIVTLWSDIEWTIGRLSEAGVDISSETSTVAAVGNLYGNGLPELLRNLLYNPQITHLLICGKDRSNSSLELVNFFTKGLEEVDFLGDKRTRISGTNRMVDDMVRPGMFSRKPVILHVGELRSAESLDKARDFFRSPDFLYKPPTERINIPLPSANISRMPSNPRNHNIEADDPLSAWIELIFRLVRFGHLTHLRKGNRQELQNVKVIVDNPSFIGEDKLKKFGFDPEAFRSYYDNFLETGIPPDTKYTYGNRIGAYFGKDTLEECIRNLKSDPEDRKSYISLWDSARDVSSRSGHPCLASLFFRKFDGKLTLSAIFRTHNSLDAWLKNFYGLMRIQNTVCEAVGMKPGAIIVISHSISVDTRKIEIAKSIAQQRGFEIKIDPNGNFFVEIEGNKIVVKHYYKGIRVKIYRGEKPGLIQHQLARDCAISDINHAIYIGRMLEQARRSIETGEEFMQR